MPWSLVDIWTTILGILQIGAIGKKFSVWFILSYYNSFGHQTEKITSGLVLANVT